MSINIGDNNKIKNANIAEKLEINDDQSVKKSFYEKHPVICGFLISLVAGIVLLFSFWDRIVNLIEGVFSCQKVKLSRNLQTGLWIRL